MWPPRKILCPTDFSEGSRTAISQATEMAKQFRAAIYLLHAISMQAPPLPTDPGYSFDMLVTSKMLDEQARKNLQEAAEQLKNAGLTTRPIVVIGDEATITTMGRVV